MWIKFSKVDIYHNFFVQGQWAIFNSIQPQFQFQRESDYEVFVYQFPFNRIETRRNYYNTYFALRLPLKKTGLFCQLHGTSKDIIKYLIESCTMAFPNW